MPETVHILRLDSSNTTGRDIAKWMNDILTKETYVHHTHSTPNGYHTVILVTKVG